VDTEGKYLYMKKIVITILAVLTSLAGIAQNANDAYMFSENLYEGTARTMAMGNAFTALGGDLGSLNINPAGSAVAGYSQFTITPSLTFTVNKAQGAQLPNTSSQPGYFQERITSRTSNTGMPNVGFTFNMKTGRESGLKNVTFGLVCNQTNSWNGEVMAKGTNANTSFMGAVANTAFLNGYLGSDLGAEDAYDFMPWREVAAFQSGMISTFGGMDDNFVGASEAVEYDAENDMYNIYLAGPLHQTFNRDVNGYKNDFVLNFGANISDFIYIGANLGFTSILYNENWYLTESAVDQNDFEIALDNGESMYFQNMRYDYGYSADGAGVYGKFGIIVTPGYGLRIGAAVQTPTAFTMDETWTQDGKTEFSTGKYSSYSPLGSAQYSFRSPMRANFGIAYTYGALGLISVDYEMADYGTMRYDTSNADREYFSEVNKDINNRFGVSHMLRAGLEMKPLPELAIRAGYSLMTSGEIKDAWGDRLEQKRTQTASFGLGYSSKGSFFADAAVQTRFLGNEYFMPYEDYTDAAGNIIEYAPEIVNHRSFWKALLTIGWRF
jgi:hypothetical protein